MRHVQQIPRGLCSDQSSEQPPQVGHQGYIEADAALPQSNSLRISAIGRNSFIG
jgi:hypothetical protein